LIISAVILGIFLGLSVFAETAPDYSNPYAPIFTDKEVYTWTDKIRITIVAPSWNADRYGIDSIGDQEGHLIKISSSDKELEPYKLTETGPSSGTFTGEVILTGFLHDVDGDANPDTSPRTMGNGPTSGFLETERDGGITISFEFADGVVLTQSVLVSWNIGEIRFMNDDYAIGETAVIRVVDLDMNLNPEAVDQFEVEVSSDSDVAGILVNVIETSEDSGMFVASISFTQSQASSGNRLFANPGDTLHVKYDDYTLPSPYSVSDNLQISNQAKFVSNVPPTERITIKNSSITDSSGTEILSPKTFDQLQIVGAVQNNQEYDQGFVFIIQIKENNGAIVSLSWIKGELSEGQELEVSQSWNPTKSGNYTIETFVWSSLSDPVPLSETLKQAYFIE
jgi:hypothetical protein